MAGLHAANRSHSLGMWLGSKMLWLFLLVLIAAAAGLYLCLSSKENVSLPPIPSRPTERARRSVRGVEETCIHPEAEVRAARMMNRVEAEADRMQHEVEVEAAEIHAQAMRAAAAVAFDQDELEPVVDPRRVVWREDYVAKEHEGRYLRRKPDGLPDLHLTDVGDRLAIWSSVDSGGLINPKGPGVRHLGLYASYARGTDYHRNAYRAADLSKGQWIDLLREPTNPHDKNAVAMCEPGSGVPFAYVQRGRAAGVARRMAAGEDLAAVSLRGPGAGRDDDSTFVLVGSRSDLKAMLDA